MSQSETTFAGPSIRLRARELLWLPIVLAGVLVVYLPSLGNALVYDDSYLVDGLFDEYASLGLRVRMLSYGSFVWLQSALGEGWWKQRLANVLIHACVVVALWALYREILGRIDPPRPEPGAAQAPASSFRDPAALGFAVGFFALNPVAVYAVAYLIQRSILLATLFVVLGLWLFARGLVRGNPWLHAAAAACYVLAVLSKEHAVLAPVAALPLYIVVARPNARRMALVAAIGAVLAGIAAFLLARRYGDILGRAFDEYSYVYLEQLARLDPDAKRHAYGLSILNEAWLFFRYGVDWFLPASGWLSIDMRPPFPVRWLTFPQAIGVAGYAAVVAGGFFLVLRHRDWRALAGLSLLFAALLFGTEFATVWVQDPFVLYRSYLWAIGVPGLVFLAVRGTPWRVLLLVGLVVGGLFAWQGLDRVFSLQDPESAWTDAIRKLPDDPRSVGRWFPYLNRGSAYVDSNSFELALHDFEASSALGDLGMGSFNKGAVLSAKGRHREALEAFDRAEKEGYALYNLPLQRGLALRELGRRDEALKELEKARAMGPPSPSREVTLLELGRTAMQVGKRDEAAQALEQLVAADPRNREGRYLLGMAYVMKGDPARARAVLDPLILEGADARAYYARALANYGLRRKADALADIDNAIRRGPAADPNLAAWRAKILAMP